MFATLAVTPVAFGIGKVVDCKQLRNQIERCNNPKLPSSSIDCRDALQSYFDYCSFYQAPQDPCEESYQSCLSDCEDQYQSYLDDEDVRLGGVQFNPDYKYSLCSNVCYQDRSSCKKTTCSVATLNALKAKTAAQKAAIAAKSAYVTYNKAYDVLSKAYQEERSACPNMQILEPALDTNL